MAVSLLQLQLGTDSSRRPSALSPPWWQFHCPSQSSAGCHLRRPFPRRSSRIQARLSGHSSARARSQRSSARHWPRGTKVTSALSDVAGTLLVASRLFTNSTSSNEGSRTIKPTETRNSRQHGLVGAVSLSYSLHKVSRYLWCAFSCITTPRALPLLLPSSDLSTCNEAKPGPCL